MMPVQSTVFLKVSAWVMAFWPVGRVEHQQDLVRRSGDLLGDDAADLLQLAHEVVCVCSRPAVSTMTTSKPRAMGLLAGVVGHAAGSLPWLFLTISQPIRSLQMVSCSTAAARKVSHAATITFLPSRLAAAGQLGDRRGLARAVDAGHHHDRRARRRHSAMPAVGRGEQVAELLLDEGLDVAGDFLVEKCLADALDDLLRGEGADVGEVEAFFQFVEEFLIDAALEAEQLAMPLKTLLIFLKKSPNMLRTPATETVRWAVPPPPARWTAPPRVFTCNLFGNSILGFRIFLATRYSAQRVDVLVIVS